MINSKEERIMRLSRGKLGGRKGSEKLFQPKQRRRERRQLNCPPAQSVEIFIQRRVTCVESEN